MASQTSDLERNLRLIPWHQAFTSALVWLPIMVLFTRSRFDLDGAFLLGALYYWFVVVLEVPSGWMSDRLGRVLTLRIAALCWIAAHTCFLLGDDRFVVIATGQFLMAAGFASLSGTDVSFHYDSLEGLGLADSYQHRQARVSAIGYVVASASAITGGVLGLIDLRAAFGLSLVLACAQFVMASRLVEPDRLTQAEAFLPQIGSCLGYLRNRYLGWLFFYGIAMVTLEHVAFTPMQPWLTEVLDRTADDLGSTPLLSGVLMAAIALIGAAAARLSSPVAQRVGVVPVLVGLGVISAAIVTVMASTTAVWAVAFVLFRSAQGAAAPVLLSAEFAPRVAQQHRATLLSLNSLAGRFGYGSILFAVSALIDDDVLRALSWLAGISWGLVALTLVTGALVARRERLAAAV